MTSMILLGFIYNMAHMAFQVDVHFTIILLKILVGYPVWDKWTGLHVSSEGFP